MNDFLKFSHNALNLLDHKIHDKIKGSFVDNFINELQDYLELRKNNRILERIPKYTKLSFARFEKDYAVCFDYSNQIIYNIPKSSIKGPLPEPGEVLEVFSANDIQVDYTGILANENEIDNLLDECSYANLPSKIKILPDYYKISKIGIDFATCKNLKTNYRENVPIGEVPRNAKKGDVLKYKNGKYTITNAFR